MEPRRVAVVAFDGAQSLDVTGPVEVFTAATGILSTLGRAGYDVGVATPDGRAATTSSGIAIGARWALDEIAGDDLLPDTLLVSGGEGAFALETDAAFIARFRDLATRCRRIGSVCTGAFVLAAAGLLDGRSATTHWGFSELLQSRCPAATVEPDAIYTRDGDTWTSAGVTAGMDLALAMVAADHDDETARHVAQWLVIYLRRSGGQSQFSTPISSAPARRDEIRRTQDWILEDPSRDCSVDRLAEVAAMSPRHFARLFHQQVGITPARFVERSRLDLARSYLESSDLTVAEVAKRCGLGDASTLHRAFERHLATSPGAYRNHFRHTPTQLRSRP